MATRARKNPNDPTKGVAVARAGRSTITKAGAMLIDEDKPLTEQQRLFATFWAQGETPSNAAAKAGYAERDFAYRLIYMPNILKVYRAEKERYERDSGMTRKRVIEGFLEGIDMAKMLAEPASVISGWREIGRMCGYYEPVQVKHTVTHEGRVVLDKMEQLSDQELAELMEKRMEQMRQALPPPPPGDDDVHAEDAE